jgi:hypothetical protein
MFDCVHFLDLRRVDAGVGMNGTIGGKIDGSVGSGKPSAARSASRRSRRSSLRSDASTNLRILSLIMAVHCFLQV